ncbi:SDR family NAD(P)-dependent oxidoreductase [Longivirga aurantiaca]|uniref:SDR family NAD(P)-dependent oxidoreductase n=1 Tax=Longivirga aurantiaca TaxID=1837743 RepID=A0ABW1T4Y2_9ACTN
MTDTRRVALVTGGASGIGQATCRRLAADGFLLAVGDLDAAGAADSAGPDGYAGALDVADESSVDSFVAAARERLGRIDVLVNNAGITGDRTATVLHTTPVAEWDKVIAVNVRGPFLLSRAVLPIMIEQGAGHVITIASVAGQVAFPGRSAYTTSKGAALQLARSIAVDYASAGIRSNAVCPGMAHTAMTSWRLDDPVLRAEVEARIPLGRVASPDDVADLVSVLASDRLHYLTGAALVIDGGYTAL